MLTPPQKNDKTKAHRFYHCRPSPLRECWGRIQHLPDPLCYNPEVILGVWHVRQTTLLFLPTSDSSAWPMRCLHTCSPNTEPSAESAKVKYSDKSQLPSVASWLGDSESVRLVSTAVSLLQSSLQARGECSLFCFFFFFVVGFMKTHSALSRGNPGYI